MTPPPMTAASPDETAETMSAEKVAIAMLPSSRDAHVSTLGALAEAGARDPSRVLPHESTLITKEAPSALVRGRAPAPAAPAMHTLPLAQTAMSPGTAPLIPRTLVSGQATKIPASPPAAAAAPILTIPSAPPPRQPSAPPQDNLRRTIIVSVAVLSVAAFTGTYLGSQRSAPPPAQSSSAATATSAPIDSTTAGTMTASPVAVTAPGPQPSASAAPSASGSTSTKTTPSPKGPAPRLGF
jgi:hypothetical protein